MSHIGKHHPELYKYLDEETISLPDLTNPIVEDAVVMQYLDDIKAFEKKYEIVCGGH